MTKQRGINAVKAIIRRNPDWTGRTDHRAMLLAMVMRIRKDSNR